MFFWFSNLNARDSYVYICEQIEAGFAPGIYEEGSFEQTFQIVDKSTEELGLVVNVGESEVYRNLLDLERELNTTAMRWDHTNQEIWVQFSQKSELLPIVVCFQDKMWEI